MRTVETLDEALLHRRHEVSEAVANDLRGAVRAVLVSKDGRNPEIVGTCMLLHIDERRYAVTAAHILDSLDTHSIYIAGAVGTQPVQLLGTAHMTRPPEGGRVNDKVDVGFWELDGSTVERLGSVSFMGAERFSHNKAPMIGRLFLAMGYPVSKNRGNVNNVDKAIKPSLSKYTGELNLDPAIAKDFGVSGDGHLFLKYHKYSESETGEKRNTFKPIGLSGGPLIDLGNFATPDKYADGSNLGGYLAGMVIERMSKHAVIVATRIQLIVDAIRSRSVS